MAELSGELSVGDIVAVGEVPLAVGRIGWTPVRGGLAEVRTREHGTDPLPDPGRPSGGGTGAGQGPAVSPGEEPGSGLVVAVTFGRRQYATRTRGGAHLYRVTQYCDSWPFEPDSRVPHGSRSRRLAETFRTLEPVRQRLARADGYARYQHRNGGDWPAFVAVAEQLTDDGLQPPGLDFPPPPPARGRRRRSGRTRR